MLATVATASVQCCVTSPPYFGLRDYGVDGQIGLEEFPDAFVAEIVSVFREVRRVLKDDGTLWLNLGDSYAGSWGNQGRKEGSGTQREKTRPSFQKFSTGSVHAIDCDMGEDCSCGADVGAIYPDKQTRTGSWVNDHPTLKAKDLIGIPWRVAFALQADGWYLRSDIIWHKPNPMPESVTDRPTKAHEYVFLLTKSARYFYDAGSIAEPVSCDEETQRVKNRTRAEQRGKGDKDGVYNARGQSAPFSNWAPVRNARSVWSITTKPFKGAHFATMPPELARRCILAGSKPGDIVLDPFGGAGTTGLVADRLGRHATLIELNPTYADMARARIEDDAPLFTEVQHAERVAA